MQPVQVSVQKFQCKFSVQIFSASLQCKVSVYIFSANQCITSVQNFSALIILLYKILYIHHSSIIVIPDQGPYIICNTSLESKPIATSHRFGKVDITVWFDLIWKNQINQWSTSIAQSSVSSFIFWMGDYCFIFHFK